MRIGPYVHALCVLTALTALTALSALSAQADPAPAADADLVDVSAFRSKLKLVSDGKNHYVAFVPFGSMEQVFYGDGKVFYQLRVHGGGSSGTESFDRMFWDPRIAWGGTSFSFRDTKYSIDCRPRHTELAPVGFDQEQALLGKAAFHKSLWKRQAYALARDNVGNYFYVDKVREDEGKNFRLFSGPKGAMKKLAMTNIVSDAGGDIFATKTGELRLVLNRGDNKADNLWVQGKKQSKLVPLVIDDNAAVIYTELGVYAGQRLGTPCDDL